MQEVSGSIPLTSTIKIKMKIPVAMAGIFLFARYCVLFARGSLKSLCSVATDGAAN
jgi:hypothetical protein